MSTTYAIVAKEKVQDVISENGRIDNPMEIGVENITEIGTTHCFISYMIPILTHLSDDTPIFATDNETRVRTLGELKEYYENYI